MIVIASKELEDILDSVDKISDNLELERTHQNVTSCFAILMRCDYEKSIRDFVLSAALSTTKPAICEFSNFEDS